MGTFYMVVAIIAVLSFIVSVITISDTVKWVSRGVLAASILAAIIFEAFQ